jgi:hypothetical protein
LGKLATNAAATCSRRRMSKRGAEGQGGEERYGSWDSGNAAMDDKPKAATAAQMAKRK